jgi:hypothetical protein
MSPVTDSDWAMAAGASSAPTPRKKCVTSIHGPSDPSCSFVRTTHVLHVTSSRPKERPVANMAPERDCQEEQEGTARQLAARHSVIANMTRCEFAGYRSQRRPPKA